MSTCNPSPPLCHKQQVNSLLTLTCQRNHTDTLTAHDTKLPWRQIASERKALGPQPQLNYARTSTLDLFKVNSDVWIPDNPGSEPTPHFLSTVNNLQVSHSKMSYSRRPKAGHRVLTNTTIAASGPRTRIITNETGEGILL
jgi:hypothetical protein